MTVYADRPDAIGITTRDGVVRHIRIKYFVARNYHDTTGMYVDLPTVRTRGARVLYSGKFGTTVENDAKILTLPALLDQAAHAYLQQGIDDALHAERARKSLTKDIIWILNRIVDGGFLEQGAGPLTPQLVKHVMDERFLGPFLRTYSQTVGDLFARAGLVPGCAF
jgi:hypothetical protein